ncbi:MAG: HAD family hydrolase [Bacteroidales bacterium]|nr:HAD family hydrolase [Bacteroidales bacterium]
MIKQPIKGLIFDYGATIDSNGKHWAEVIWEGYNSVKFDISKERFREAYVFAERALAKTPYIKPEHNFLDMLRIKMNLQLDYMSQNGFIPKDDYSLACESVAQYCYQYAGNCILKAKPVLEVLSKRYKFVLVSNFYGNIESVLSDFGLSDFFPKIVESAVVGVRKPDPKIFSLGVEAMNLAANEIVVIGDSYSKDIVPATTIGCQTIWIKGIAWDDKEDNISHPDIITDFSQLLSTDLMC